MKSVMICLYKNTSLPKISCPVILFRRNRNPLSNPTISFYSQFVYKEFPLAALVHQSKYKTHVNGKILYKPKTKRNKVVQMFNFMSLPVLRRDVVILRMFPGITGKHIRHHKTIDRCHSKWKVQ